jgi:hypothetical protein
LIVASKSTKAKELGFFVARSKNCRIFDSALPFLDLLFHTNLHYSPSTMANSKGGGKETLQAHVCFA